jgi:hypothetical protein
MNSSRLAKSSVIMMVGLDLYKACALHDCATHLVFCPYLSCSASYLLPLSCFPATSKDIYRKRPSLASPSQDTTALLELWGRYVLLGATVLLGLLLRKPVLHINPALPLLLTSLIARRAYLAV